MAVLEKTQWLQNADAKRLAVLKQALEAAPLPRVTSIPQEEPKPMPMQTERDAAAMDVGPPKKQRRGGVAKRKGKKKISILAGMNQFHKKKKKGVR